MACECGKGAPCTCSFHASATVDITGSGLPEDPFILSIETLTLEVNDTATVLATLGGDGSVETPYSLSMRIAPSVLSQYWDKWFGSQDEYDPLVKKAGTFHVITSPTRYLPGVVNLYVGTTRVTRVYMGTVMVANDLGTTLGPGI